MRRALSRTFALNLVQRRAAAVVGGRIFLGSPTGPLAPPLDVRGGVNDLVFSPDGAHLAVASDDGTVRVWSVPGGDLALSRHCHAGRHRSTGPNGAVAVRFSPDGRLLASGGGDRAVRVWRTDTWTEVATLRGHGGPVTALAFSADGRALVSGSADSSALVWEVSVARPDPR